LFVSATYRLPAESSVRPCGLLNVNGVVPVLPGIPATSDHVNAPITHRTTQWLPKLTMNKVFDDQS